MSEPVRLERVGGVGWITIDNPPANALSLAVMEGLEGRLAEADAAEDLHALVLTGAGDRFFVAGADIREFTSDSAESVRAKMARGHRLTLSMERHRLPVVAALNGFALGGGLELAMACDVRVASSGARLGQPEILLGIIPGWGGTQRLPRLVGRGRALELLLSGDQVSADRALELGLVERVVAPEQLHAECQALAEELATRAPLALAAIKRALSDGLGRPLEEALVSELEEFCRVFGSADAREGVAAFLEKRSPKWKGQ